MIKSEMLKSNAQIDYLQIDQIVRGAKRGETRAGLLGPRCYASVVATRAMTSRVATTNSAVAENDSS
jgi:hypothetical protein